MPHEGDDHHHTAGGEHREGENKPFRQGDPPEVSGNPLASPDILGITGGAGATAVFLVTVSGGAS
ncbi:hypothetical protein ACWDRX_37605, partial [Streptomyces nigra]